MQKTILLATLLFSVSVAATGANNKALIVVGGNTFGGEDVYLHVANHASKVLKRNGFSSVRTLVRPSFRSLDYSLMTQFINADNAVLLILAPTANNGDLLFLNPQTYTASLMRSRLIVAKTRISNSLTVIHDGPNTHRFVEQLAFGTGPSDAPYLVANQQGYRAGFLGLDTVAHLLFTGILAGDCVKEAALSARNAQLFIYNSSGLVIDANGNGLFNELFDGFGNTCFQLSL